MSPFALFVLAAVAGSPALESARDRQDRAALARTVSELAEAAKKNSNDAEAQYRLALAASYLAEVSLELRDKQQAQRAAETGIPAAEKAIALNPRVAEYYRVLGTLCGQVVPANVLAGLSYGKRARESIDKAIELDPKSSRAYLARGIGNYYLPPTFGGGVDRAIADFQKAVQLDATSAEAYLWLGVALRKAGRNAKAREAFGQSMKLNPNRIWTKQQLEKTPAQ